MIDPSSRHRQRALAGERGPDVVLPLLPIEQAAYGISSQRVQTRATDSGRVLLHLRALPSRELTIDSYRNERGVCQANVVLAIAGQQAVLRSAFAKTGYLSVEHIRLTGTTLTGQLVQEIIDPSAL